VWQYAAPRRAAQIQVYPSFNISADPKDQPKPEKYVFSFLDTLWVTGILCGQYTYIWLRYRFAYTPLTRNAKTEIHTKRGIKLQAALWDEYDEKFQKEQAWNHPETSVVLKNPLIHTSV
jgi:hypothetical protein